MPAALAPAIGEVDFSDVDIHFARLMCRLSADDRRELEIAAALASRATRNGDVCARLSEFAEQPMPLFAVTAPPLAPWLALLHECPVVGRAGDFRPLVLDEKGRLYLYRYWDYEKRLADNLLARASDAGDIDEALLRKGLKHYFPNRADEEQKLAAASAVLRRLSVISGGPGTGKTTTVVKILALLADQAAGRKLAIAVAAPTGKAAARVQDAMHAALDGLDLDLFGRASMPGEALTIHRLLGARGDSVYYRYGPDNPLPLDVLVVDEASMADLALTVKLLEALPARTRVILLGDKDQLASVEAGAVLGDICRRTGYSARFAKRLSSVASVPVASIARNTGESGALTDSIVLLNKSYRFGAESGIGTLARLVNEGRDGEAVSLLKDGAHTDIAWQSVGAAELRQQLSVSVVEQLRAYFDAIAANEAPETVFALFNRFRLLCAHRSGPFGVTALNGTIEELLEERRALKTRDAWYAGRPVMIARNDYDLRLFNGDVGITLPDPGADGALKVYFPGGGQRLRGVSPGRLPQHETVYAMTVHKAQGSEFAQVLLLLPTELSPIMSRELIYTGLTRAIEHVEIWGSEAVFRGAVKRRLDRASALQERLWSTAAP
jgi:exodeoxyribonuclease V alpha subunit